MAEPLRVAMDAYYRGERNKVLLIISGSIVAVALAFVFYTTGVSHFARGVFYTGAAGDLASGFVIGVLGVFVPVSIVSAWRWRRESSFARRASSALDTPDGLSALGEEARHMTTVVAKSLRRQYAALGLGMSAVVAAAVLSHPFVVGVTACVLVLVASEQVLDHFTEARAMRYARALGSTTVGGRAVSPTG